MFCLTQIPDRAKFYIAPPVGMYDHQNHQRGFVCIQSKPTSATYNRRMSHHKELQRPIRGVPYIVKGNPIIVEFKCVTIMPDTVNLCTAHPAQCMIIKAPTRNSVLYCAERKCKEAFWCLHSKSMSAR